jgi:hypothetical protein
MFAQVEIPLYTSELKPLGHIKLTTDIFKKTAEGYGMKFSSNYPMAVFNCSDSAVLLFHVITPSGQPHGVMVGGVTDKPLGTDALNDVFHKFERGKETAESLRQRVLHPAGRPVGVA